MARRCGSETRIESIVKKEDMGMEKTGRGKGSANFFRGEDGKDI